VNFNGTDKIMTGDNIYGIFAKDNAESKFVKIGEALAYMLSAVTHFQNVFLEHITALPFSVITDIEINIWQLLIIYVIIFCVSRIAFILLRTSCHSGY
jgi:hypothetical protein